MSTSSANRAIVAALVASSGVAIAKFIAWSLSGSSSMLASAVHSVADAGDLLLLLLSGRTAKRGASAAHPHGHGRARHAYAFVFSIILFTVCGTYSLYEGFDSLTNPRPLESAWLPIVVLSIAIVLESFPLRTAIIESNRARGTQSWVEFVRRSTAPEWPLILLRSIAALGGLVLAMLGVGLTIITGDSVFDAVGTLAIGVLLILVAIIFGLETKSLLVGEGATADDAVKIRDAINADEHVESLIHMTTLYLGPEELLVAAKIAFAGRTRLTDVAAAITSVEARIREVVPVARVIYLEPDVLVQPGEGNPATETIVIKAAD